jgi:3-oxoacyl-[acyl-carrier-protein] synthase III
MANLAFNNVGISGLCSVVPSKRVRNIDMSSFIPKEEIEKTINSIGIIEKRYVEPTICASDLCFRAAEKLIAEMEIDKSTIDVLIFMSQTPDYRIPATAPSLQHRLGLSKNTAAFDISLSCSGYIYSLSVAYLYASSPMIRRVLLLDGETFSKIVNLKDKVNAPLYGDAGTATIIEKGDFGLSYFSLNSDGSGFEAIKIPAGGSRNMSDCENLKEKTDKYGNIRSDHQIYMDGGEVFNFTMREVPKDIKNLLSYANTDIESLDYMVFHQANKFMTDFFSKKLKVASEKIPYCLDKFGNTSSASIPLTISSELSSELKTKRKKILMSGFGAGLSWGTALIDFNNCNVVKVFDYQL